MNLLPRIAQAEDRANRLVGRWLRRLGWLPVAVGYGGYGSENDFPTAGAVGFETLPSVTSPTEAGTHRKEDRETSTPVSGETPSGSARILARVLMAPPGTWRFPVRPSGVAEDWIGEVKSLAQPTGRLDTDRRGWRQFIDTQVPGYQLEVALGKTRQQVRADRGGYLDVVLQGHGLAAGDHVATLTVPTRADGTGSRLVTRVPVRIVAAQPAAPASGIICDVDDTVMVSWLPSPLLAAHHAFIQPIADRRPVPGMAQFLTTLARDSDLVIYLSTGAWNIAPVLHRFLRRHGFPAGIPLLTDWGPSSAELFRSGRAHKDAQLLRLATELPQLNWQLVGDDGQNDPSIYSDFARLHPHRVKGIYLRTLGALEHIRAHGTPTPTDVRSSRLRWLPKTQQHPRRRPGTQVAGVPVFTGADGFILQRRAKLMR